MTTKPLINQNHVKYIQGSLPIIISSCHGGNYSPKDIPNRDFGVFDMDDYTQQLTQEILEEFFARTNQFPHAVIMNLSRKKVDANRSIEEATTNDKKAISSYKSFHDFIKESKNQIEKNFSKGLYIDIHGQSHSHQAIEFGYLLTNDILRQSDAEIERYENFSSIKVQQEFSPFSFSEQVRGNFSLGTLMMDKGFDSIPSSKIPSAPRDDEYFEGAYNTRTHGSLISGKVAGIQIEFPYNCRDSKESRVRTAKALVSSIIEYMLIHFGIDLKN
ncbi:hypothetical protein [Poseidonibacter lekithochrous]|uniref:hypothetical protein n=1 Tax=Poseidonibacter lekithochrous TaxID=1904463 RepID=UPI0008FC4406|nr:hypothetical protein [Poseidonibacter lekithochrous]QKJ21521.1 hypothetical protein ALEK_0201 [Poseidonibacter lekithochrous]